MGLFIPVCKIIFVTEILKTKTMKKKKLNLKDLKVESFITTLDENIVKTINGGTQYVQTEDYASMRDSCQNTCRKHCSDLCPTPSGFWACTIPGMGC